MTANTNDCNFGLTKNVHRKNTENIQHHQRMNERKQREKETKTLLIYRKNRGNKMRNTRNPFNAIQKYCIRKEKRANFFVFALDQRHFFVSLFQPQLLG